MPTARLSREFYDKFGDKIVNELVGLLNDMDGTFRAELRELNEHNFQRFDAKLEQRVAEVNARLDQLSGELNAKIEQRIAELNAKIEQRIAELNAKLDQRTAELNARMDQRIAEVRTDMGNLKAELIKWMFLFWLGNVATLLGFGRLLLP